MEQIVTLKAGDQEAFKNYFVKEGEVGIVANHLIKKPDYFSQNFLDWVVSFDVTGTTMHYKLKPDYYIWLYVLFDDHRLSLFVIGINDCKGVDLNTMKNKKIKITYTGPADVVGW